jgi:hypothetical protein
MSQIIIDLLCALHWHNFSNKGLEVGDDGTIREYPKCIWCGELNKKIDL